MILRKMRIYRKALDFNLRRFAKKLFAIICYQQPVSVMCFTSSLVHGSTACLTEFMGKKLADLPLAIEQ